jgi:heat shock protein HtpX
LHNLNDAEVEAVLGHELTHIRNGDVRMLVIAVIVAGVIGFFAELTFRMLFRGGWRMRGGGGGSRGRGKGGGLAIVIALALIAAAWLLSTAIRFALSRRREFLADAGAVELTKNPDAMISALRRIEGRGELEGATSAIMEMCVDNPRQGFTDLFATHPSIDARVAALVQYAGGHDPGLLQLPLPGESPWHDEAAASDAGGEPPKTFLPAEPPVTLGGPAAPGPAAPDQASGPPPGSPPGPWGPHRN